MTFTPRVIGVEYCLFSEYELFATTVSQLRIFSRRHPFSLASPRLSSTVLPSVRPVVITNVNTAWLSAYRIISLAKNEVQVFSESTSFVNPCDSSRVFELKRCLNKRHASTFSREANPSVAQHWLQHNVAPPTVSLHFLSPRNSAPFFTASRSAKPLEGSVPFVLAVPSVVFLFPFTSSSLSPKPSMASTQTFWPRSSLFKTMTLSSSRTTPRSATVDLDPKSKAGCCDNGKDKTYI